MSAYAGWPMSMGHISTHLPLLKLSLPQPLVVHLAPLAHQCARRLAVAQWLLLEGAVSDIGG